MKMFANWMTSSWAESIGWALLHSLWQSLVILLVITALFRFVSKRDSVTRYVIATSGLVAMLVMAIATFLYLFLTAENNPESTTAIGHTSHQIISPDILPTDYVESILTPVARNIHWMTTCWMIGTMLFTLRLAGSWWYVSSLRTNALTVEGQWHKQMMSLAKQLDVRFIPELAESTRVTAPVVIGYLKPVILLPVGMISWLGTAQIEAILLHELTHIKRHDYVVNILQALIEAVLFFNPFVWIASSIIRREREHCCDDAVIMYSDPRTYATALAQLEEMRLTRTGLALSLAENKNQLLNRIKRIMENSVKNYSSREKMIPVLLLITGLVCASWVTLQSQEKPKQETQVVPADTTKKKSNTRTFKYKSVTRVGEDGKPKEEIVQYYDSDADNHGHYIFAMPAVPPVDFTPPTPHIEMVAPLADFDFPLPPTPPEVWDAKEWEAFGEEFEVQFKENFADFYKEHHDEFEQMMQEVEVNMHEKFDSEWAQEIAVTQQKAAMEHQREAMERAAEAMEAQREAMEQIKFNMDDWQKDHDVRMKELDANLKKMEENMRRFEAELVEQLIKDGYVKKGEKIDHICWKQDGTVEINDIKIKDSDLPKYRKLQEKYFDHDDNGDFMYVK